MLDLDKIAGRMIDLESKYYDLQEKYQLLIHHYEDLKAEYEAYRSRHRDNIRSQHDLDGSH